MGYLKYMVRISGIYRIRNSESGKCYIGSAVDIHQRWLEHKSMLKRGAHHSPHLQNSWNKHGESAFEFEVLEVCDIGSLIVMEQRAIDLMSPEFNVCRIAGSTAGRRHSEETKAKISSRIKGTKHAPRSDEYRKKISEAHKGREKSPEHLAALQEGRKKQVYTPERRNAISAGLINSYRNGLRSRNKSESHKRSIGRAFAKLSDDQVRSIRERKKSGETCKSLAIAFGSNAGTISEICAGKRYRWVV